MIRFRTIDRLMEDEHGQMRQMPVIQVARSSHQIQQMIGDNHSLSQTKSVSNSLSDPNSDRQPPPISPKRSERLRKRSRSSVSRSSESNSHSLSMGADKYLIPDEPSTSTSQSELDVFQLVANNEMGLDEAIECSELSPWLFFAELERRGLAERVNESERQTDNNQDHSKFVRPGLLSDRRQSSVPPSIDETECLVVDGSPSPRHCYEQDQEENCAVYIEEEEEVRTTSGHHLSLAERLDIVDMIKPGSPIALLLASHNLTARILRMYLEKKCNLRQILDRTKVSASTFFYYLRMLGLSRKHPNGSGNGEIPMALLCNLCGQTYSTKSNLRRHWMRCSKVKRESSQVNGRSSKSLAKSVESCLPPALLPEKRRKSDRLDDVRPLIMDYINGSVTSAAVAQATGMSVTTVLNYVNIVRDERKRQQKAQDLEMGELEEDGCKNDFLLNSLDYGVQNSESMPGAKRFMCGVCVDKFRSKIELLQHLRGHDVGEEGEMVIENEIGEYAHAHYVRDGMMRTEYGDSLEAEHLSYIQFEHDNQATPTEDNTSYVHMDQDQDHSQAHHTHQNVESCVTDVVDGGSEHEPVFVCAICEQQFPDECCLDKHNELSCVPVSATSTTSMETKHSPVSTPHTRASANKATTSSNTPKSVQMPVTSSGPAPGRALVVDDNVLEPAPIESAQAAAAPTEPCVTVTVDDGGQEDPSADTEHSAPVSVHRIVNNKHMKRQQELAIMMEYVHNRLSLQEAIEQCQVTRATFFRHMKLMGIHKSSKMKEAAWREVDEPILRAYSEGEVTLKRALQISGRSVRCFYQHMNILRLPLPKRRHSPLADNAHMHHDQAEQLDMDMDTAAGLRELSHEVVLEAVDGQHLLEEQAHNEHLMQMHAQAHAQEQCGTQPVDYVEGEEYETEGEYVYDDGQGVPMTVRCYTTNTGQVTHTSNSAQGHGHGSATHNTANTRSKNARIAMQPAHGLWTHPNARSYTCNKTAPNNFLVRCDRAVRTSTNTNTGPVHYTVESANIVDDEQQYIYEQY